MEDFVMTEKKNFKDLTLGLKINWIISKIVLVIIIVLIVFDVLTTFDLFKKFEILRAFDFRRDGDTYNNLILLNYGIYGVLQAILYWKDEKYNRVAYCTMAASIFVLYISIKKFII